MVALAIMAKAPVPGFCKTRLMPALGAEGAARLQAWLLQHSLAVARASGLRPLQLWAAPDIEHPLFQALARPGDVRLQAQFGHDLGMRMLYVFTRAQGPLLLIGTDCPPLTPALLLECAACLETHDAVFLPAEDGGYALIGLQQPQPELFVGIDWSTERVMAQTRERLTALGLRWQEPAVVWDLDRPEDLQRLPPGLLTAALESPLETEC
ncbi:hypothetical protein CLV44_101122 [Marinobacterium halophilum]|uniref:Glycosyltransferase A (GT-A) superfamily protein (DUF2064 family) n=1 Tax=Marinobacterium halophilum TaxID=267374 RepID=A0A2P8F4T3_9GAMM|nr:TIGR04282 family arsenosugar biosynthesis glycosyltransferase [Marinobacterium halophilum]PSL16724.1 hypothetical protein CLV44_101122 [Marinobacterium halophilum]